MAANFSPSNTTHTYEVKRGTFLGEMSRLATLSSKYEHYSAALQGLVLLYVKRGYPVDEVHKWLVVNVAKRWESRLADPPQVGTDVLVMKTQYNLAWNYFNAHQLGDVIFEYWGEWLKRADAGNYSHEYPPPDPKDVRVSDWGDPEVSQLHRWDLRETNLFNSKVIVSRKRTRNFLDLTNLWKKTVLENLEEQALDDVLTHIATHNVNKRPELHDVNTLVVGPQPKKLKEDPENELERPYDRRSSPTPRNQWASGSMGTWGRGRL